MTSKTPTNQDEFCDRFIRRLEDLVKDKDYGALATLRRGLGKDVPFEAYRFMPVKRTRWQEDAALTVGPLFALWHQGEDKAKSAGESENLGVSMLALVDAMEREGTKREDAMKRVERRFSALLNCHVDDLKVHLRHTVSLLRSNEVPVNWRWLLRDVQSWNQEDHWVQREWASSFWAPATEGDKPLDVNVPSETSGETDVDSSDE